MKTEKLAIKSFTFPSSVQFTSFHHTDLHSADRPDTRPHRHKYYEILFFKEAFGITHHLDATPYEITPGSLYFIAPRQVHFISRTLPSFRFEIYAITFSEDFLAKVLAEAGYAEVINELFTLGGCLSFHQRDVTYEMLWNQMKNEIVEKKMGFERCVVNQFRNLLIYLRRKQYNNDFQKPDHITERDFLAFERLVQHHYTQQWTVQQYAQALYKSSKQLNRLCNKVKGCAPQRYIHEQVSMEAKRYLSHSSLQIKEIAGILGFDDQAYFSKFFKKINGESPEKFRSRMTQKGI
jgi:AraC-like DNA-binding protein